MATQISEKDWPAYLRWMLAALTLTIAAVGAFNIVIDPLGVFGSPRVAGLNAIKPYLDHHREFARWQSARRLCADTGIFGNSRAEIGFDPESSFFADKGLSVFNHSIPGSSASLTYRQLNWLESIGCLPQTVVLGVEFFDFLGGSKPSQSSVLNGDPAPRVDAQFLAETVFSVAGLRDSIETLFAQHARYPATLTDRGFNPIYNYIPDVARAGQYVFFRQRAEENARIWKRKQHRLRPDDYGVSEDEQWVNAILGKVSGSGRTVYVIIYPYHAQIRMMIERLGLGGLFAEWKKMVVNMAARQHNDGKVEVWDFSGVTSESTEAIPARGDRHTHLKYYWESGHFKKALGDRIIANVLGDETGFGVRLDNGNVDRWLVEDRNRVQALLTMPSPLLSEVDDVLAHSAKK